MLGVTEEQIRAALPRMTAAERAELDRLLGFTPRDFTPERLLFGPQLAFVADPATFKTALCSRRAGKTIGCAVDLLLSNLRNPRAPSLYFTLTRGSAKRIIWPTLLRLNRRYRLGYEPNESDLVLKRDGFAAVVLSGADTRGEIEKWRGVAWGKIVGDEAQALPEYLREAVDEVLMPSLMDHDGTISLIGTPAPVPSGCFYEYTQSSEWKPHRWTVFDNPYIKNPRVHLERACRARGVAETDPSIQREFFGRWVYDPNALVFRFDAARNHYDRLPALSTPWEHVIGVDIGYEDADAIVVLAFNRASPAAYLAHEEVHRRQGITELAERIAAAVERFRPQSVVMDTGGLGRKIAEELQRRHGLPVKAAEKSRKLEFIELVNDAFRTGRLLVPRGCRVAQDAMLVEWDRDRSKGEQRVISERVHSDVLDALLYAFRESLHWLHEPDAPKPETGSDAWAEAQERAMEEAARLRVEEQCREGDEWGEWSGWGG